MNAGITETLQVAVTRLLRPLVRILLRYGIPYGVFADIAKRTYVDVSMKHFAVPGRKQSVSRTAIITGLSRKEVARVLQLPKLSDAPIQDRYNRAVRVVSGWARDPAFTTVDGAPRPLLPDGPQGSFAQLVAKYSGDVPVRAMLDELQRVDAVTRSADGMLHLKTPAYVPETGLEDKLAILGTDVRDLIGTIEHNLTRTGDETRLQLKVAYDNLPQERVPQFRALSSEQTLRLLRQLDEELSELDRDVNSASTGTGRIRAGIAIYYFEQEHAELDEEASR
ncbi:MAG: hypothetical protein HY342_04480 [Candidatus Lambdaproteobacteria bacterium]|nr:hypothetical protein [Candidatus Lambdaproteobacteria bacterium]